MSDENVKVKFVYGFACSRPEVQAVIVGPPPLKWWEIIYYGAVELWYWTILPALLVALSFTAFLYAIKAVFS